MWIFDGWRDNRSFLMGTASFGLQPEIRGLYIGVVHEFLVGAFQNGASIFKNIPVVDDRQNGTGVLFRDKNGNSCL